MVQLRHLLGEMEVLRQRVTDTDLDKFDRLTEKSRQLTMKAIKEYIGNGWFPPHSVIYFIEQTFLL